ncbi:hypothetical protein N9K75_02615 [bacterium]|nr:hypothetical protein [bacterium]
MVKFFYNGLKTETGAKLQKASYSKGYYTPESGIPADSITIYATQYTRFTKEIKEVFTVENDSDSMTDYFEHDRIRVAPTHPLYADVSAAHAKAQARHLA